MRETTLMKVALCCILLGLPVLYVVSDLFGIDERLAERATGTARQDSITGKVVSVRNSERATTLRVATYTDVLIFDKVNISKDATVVAKGRKDNQTLIASEVRIR